VWEVADLLIAQQDVTVRCEVRCSHFGSKRPWGSVLYLKQNERKPAARPSLPDGETLDSIWEAFGNRCVLCSAPKSFLTALGVGRQVHHVIPYAEDGHRGPLIPVCTHCHEVANARQRVYWFLQRVLLKPNDRGGEQVATASPETKTSAA